MRKRIVTLATTGGAASAAITAGAVTTAPAQERTPSTELGVR